MTDAAPKPEQAEDDFPLVSALMLVGRVPVPDVLAAIQCFREQTYPYKELILVNNARTQFDASELNIRAERDVFLIDTPNEVSAGMAKNIGIRAANGQILAQFDCDSWHDPQRLEAQIATLAENEAHVCLLSSTLLFSFISGRASLNINDKEAALSTMIFLRPADIDYPDAEKNEEYGMLDRLVQAGHKPIAMSKPELCCKFRLTTGDRVETPTNHGLTKKQFQVVKRILKDRSVFAHALTQHQADQKIGDEQSEEEQTVST
jgi:glycosyltransferase involved in cell wall biosynthesis